MLSAILDQLSSVTAETRELRAREFLFHQGDRARNIFAVEDGHIKLTRYLSNGKSVVMHVARAGHTFTEAALFSDVYHCNAIAQTKARVRSYSKKEVLAAINRDAQLAFQCIASLSHEVQRLRLQLEVQSIASSRERILQFLLLGADPQSLEFTLRTPLKDMAANLGLAHETFYRELARLERDKLIERGDKVIKIRGSRTL
jgi:CRP/FNR family transcriptional regulator, dissimilatory nitrate respiration regulator